MGAHFEEGLKSFPGSDQVPVEIFLLIHCFFDATLTSNLVFLRDNQIFVIASFSFHLYKALKDSQIGTVTCLGGDLFKAANVRLI